MHRDPLIARPDLHRALPLTYLHRPCRPFPVNAVAGPFPADEAVPGHLAVLPEVRRQGGPSGKLPQVGTFLPQHLPRHPVRRPVHPPVGHAVAPLQSLAIEVGVVGETHAGPHVAPHILDPALHLSLGLGPVGAAQPYLEAHPHGEVQHPAVPLHLAVFVPSQRHHLGIVVKAAAGYAAQVLVVIDVALDEGGRVRPSDQLYVAGTRPPQCHHEYPTRCFLPSSSR